MFPFHPWYQVTRLGDAGLLVPCALLIAASLALRRRDWRLALLWLLPLSLAVLLTTLTKIAFIGFGVGIAALDFTGVSGHSMFAAAVYPMLGFAIGSGANRRLRIAAVAAGYGVALLVAISRWKLGMHSASECVAGFAMGGSASAIALGLLAHPPWPSLRLTALAVLVTVLAGTAVQQGEEALLPTHGMVTWVSLKISGRSHPYTRADLHRLRIGEKNTPAAEATGV
jgi:membrane-associated phospholipid phosphatase